MQFFPTCNEDDMLSFRDSSCCNGQGAACNLVYCKLIGKAKAAGE